MAVGSSWEATFREQKPAHPTFYNKQNGQTPPAPSLPAVPAPWPPSVCLESDADVPNEEQIASLN